MSKQQQVQHTQGPFDCYPWLRCDSCGYPFQHVTFNQNVPHPCPMCPDGQGKEQPLASDLTIAQAEGR